MVFSQLQFLFFSFILITSCNTNNKTIHSKENTFESNSISSEVNLKGDVINDSSLSDKNSHNSQDVFSDELSFEVIKINPPISITKLKLKEANTVADLNKYFKPEWINEYISVEITTNSSGGMNVATTQDGKLSQEQKDNINMADLGSNIAVKIQYIPENNLSHNEMKEINFTFIIEPEIEAMYIGGVQALNQYLKTNAIDKIPDNSFIGYDLAAIEFTIDEEGKITNTHVSIASNNEEIDELLLHVISEMPNWKPAEYNTGLKTNQEFVLTVGNMENCMIYTINIDHDVFDE